MDEADALADGIVLIDRGQEVIRGTAGELKAAVGGQRLVLQFADEADARVAARELAAAGQDARVNGSAVDVDLAAAREAIGELQTLGGLLGSTVDRLERFALREPSLQDVFLHFTGRDLRH